MLEVAKETHSPLTITCNKCGEKIAYIGSADDRHTRQLTLEQAIRQHVCKVKLKFN